jgi:hypothetical protein
LSYWVRSIIIIYILFFSFSLFIILTKCKIPEWISELDLKLMLNPFNGLCIIFNKILSFIKYSALMEGWIRSFV